jgi:hypothetical protein
MIDCDADHQRDCALGDEALVMQRIWSKRQLADHATKNLVGFPKNNARRPEPHAVPRDTASTFLSFESFSHFASEH